MGDWYLVIKKIRGGNYLYRQKSWREGASVRTQCECLGPTALTALGGFRGVTLQKSAGSRPRALPEHKAVELWDADGLVELKADELSERQRQAISTYAGSGHVVVNGLLRGGETIGNEDAHAMSAILEALERPEARLKHDLHLYRKCLIQGPEMRPGQTFDDFAFMSFSINRQSAATFATESRKGHHIALIRLRAKAGDRGYLSARGLSMFPGEKEILRMGAQFMVINTNKDCEIVTYEIEEVF